MWRKSNEGRAPRTKKISKLSKQLCSLIPSWKWDSEASAKSRTCDANSEEITWKGAVLLRNREEMLWSAQKHELHKTKGQSPWEDGWRQELERTTSFYQNQILFCEKNAQGGWTVALWPEKNLRELREENTDDWSGLTWSLSFSLFLGALLPLLFPMQPCLARKYQSAWGYPIPQESGGLSCGGSGIWGLMQVLLNFTAADHSKIFACVFPVKVIFHLTLFSLTDII